MEFGYFTLSDNHYENNPRTPNQFVEDITNEALYAAGAEAIFPPGTVIADAAEELIHKLNAQLGHSAAAE